MKMTNDYEMQALRDLAGTMLYRHLAGRANAGRGILFGVTGE